MRKILMISYYYPPLVDVGSLRVLAFARYLTDFGWEPYVISVKNPDKHWCLLGNDMAPDGVKVFYTRSILNLSWIIGKLNGLFARILIGLGIKTKRPIASYLFCLPDQFVGWIPLTFLKGLNLIKKHDIDLIYVTCKPFSSAIIGTLLKTITKKPLILDFRDPVSPLIFISGDKYYKKAPSSIITREIEKRVLRHADRLILVTEETKELYHSFFPFLNDNDKVSVIYNGFEEHNFSRNYESFEKFTIVYSGNFYNLEIPPDPFFKAMHYVLMEEEDIRNNIDFLYVGHGGEWLNALTERYELRGAVKITGYVPREKSIEYICKSSMLLLRIVPKMISTKLFEGLAAGVPILALTNEGEVSKIIRKYSKAPFYVVKPDDVTEIAQAIKDAYKKWRNRQLLMEKNPVFYQDFSKKKLTADFASILNTLVNNKSSSHEKETSIPLHK